jgi:3-oxoacyl-(acyl-carrier-protein) synthase III
MNTHILGTGSYVPERVLSNAELAARLGIDEHDITGKTGIVERRVAAADEATSDLATEAARRAMRDAGVGPADIGLIVLATSTPDRPIPATACTVQANLGAHGAVAFDVDAVCTGFVYAFAVARAMLLADDTVRAALVIGADTYSRILDYTDRRTSILFGDGAGAVVLARSAGQDGVPATLLGTDGTQADLVHIAAGGSRAPASERTVADRKHYFAMRGGEVRRITAKILPALMSDLLRKAAIGIADVDLLVPHQANGVMLRDWARELELPPGVMHTTVERYGNTGAASVPVTLDQAVRSGRLSYGATVVLVALGGGVTWGGIVLRWTRR